MKTVSGTSNGHALNIVNTLIADKETSGAGGGGVGCVTLRVTHIR